VNEVAETCKVPAKQPNGCSNFASEEDGLPPISHIDSILSSHHPGLAYPPTFFLFFPPTVSFEANNQFIKLFYRIRSVRKNV
jgi:hypothetical protein